MYYGTCCTIVWYWSSFTWAALTLSVAEPSPLLPSPLHRKLSLGLCEVVQDFALLSFVPLAIQVSGQARGQPIEWRTLQCAICLHNILLTGYVTCAVHPSLLAVSYTQSSCIPLQSAPVLCGVITHGQ